MIRLPSSLDAFASAAKSNGGTAVKDIAAAASQPASTPDDEESLREAVAAINRAAQALNNSVQLSIDAASGRTVVRVVDSETGQLVRQIPSEEVLELRRALDRITGMLIHRTA